MSSLESRLKKLEEAQPPDLLVIRLARRGEELVPEEEAALKALEREQLTAGQGLVISSWSHERARQLGAAVRQDQQPKGPRLGVTLVRRDGRPLFQL